MEKTFIFLMLIVLVGCATVQKSETGFNYVQLATKLTGYDYMNMPEAAQKATANGFLIGIAYEQYGRLVSAPINAMDLTKRIKQIIKRDPRITRDTIFYAIAWEAIKQIMTEQQAESA